MKNVWIVEDNEYEQGEVRAIFTTEELAKAYAHLCSRSVNIAERPLFAHVPETVTYHRVAMVFGLIAEPWEGFPYTKDENGAWLRRVSFSCGEEYAWRAGVTCTARPWAGMKDSVVRYVEVAGNDGEAVEREAAIVYRIELAMANERLVALTDGGVGEGAQDHVGDGDHAADDGERLAVGHGAGELPAGEHYE
jgi:hypothetical protein